MAKRKISWANQLRLSHRFLWSPGNALAGFEDANPFAVPFIMASATGILFQLLSLPFVNQLTQNSFPSAISEQQVSENLRLIRRSQVWGAALSPIPLSLKWVCVAGMIFTVLQVMGAKMSYRRTLSLVAFSSFFISLELPIVWVILLLRGVENIKAPVDLMPPIGLNILFPNADVGLYALLNNMNLFEMWYVGILISGVAYFNRFSIRRAALFIVPVWLFLVGLQVSFTVLILSLK